MIKINKGTEPNTLTQFRANPVNNHNYNGIDFKGQKDCEKQQSGNLRWHLLKEQGYLCCYCLSRIGCRHSKIEHFKPQSKYPQLQIDYKNLFIACSGDSDTKFHCDTRKGDQELSSVDLLINIENRISYEKTGKIKSSDPSLEKDLIEILNINSPVLVEHRKQTYSDFIHLIRKKTSGTWTKFFIRKMINKYQQKNEKGLYAEHYDMIIFFLRKKLNRI